VAQLVEQTIRNRQVMGSNPIGGSVKKVVFPLAIQEGKTTIFYGLGIIAVPNYLSAIYETLLNKAG
jgi:hypothetical protein